MTFSLAPDSRIQYPQKLLCIELHKSPTHASTTFYSYNRDRTNVHLSGLFYSLFYLLEGTNDTVLFNLHVCIANFHL